MGAVGTETLLAAGYAVFLAVVALGLDLLARQSHRRSELYRTAGFTFESHRDAWTCPEGETLHRIETDLERRVARYRAPAHICNSCPRKADCTDSNSGREVIKALDPWPHSEAGRFHRVIAIAIVCFGFLMLGAGAGLHHGPGDLAVLGAALLISTAVALYLLADFRRTPSGFPWPEGELSGPAPIPPSGGDRLERRGWDSNPRGG